MDILQNKSDADLIRSLLAEVAKSQNEIRCAQGDLNKSQNRINFCLALINELQTRNKDQRK